MSGAGGGLELRAEVPALDEALALYDAVGWGAYTREPETLERALRGSGRVVTARRDGQLLGLARVVGDGAVIAYLQDVLVHPGAQGQGIGRRLVEEVFAPYEAVRQQVLLTDAEPGQRAFYEALGFVEAHDHDPGLRAFVRLH
ncbi:GNAT family N-acetyltransferase [Brachybacterium saurashtrense]|uniref:N-acetyltransferase n=1 Tax=Brachybacterium saurashtrense TaxID=556288 RepID=A0A345YRB7_9MICO|nr:GNAT family N-acetyltransferase [Brachybacterium saurashtrense]AXK46469.1 N-acetyltransferase [Brachybacterium saurashtrense]RRR24210.1 N-acetyltransferase [Brachybacterium saurashtrense]